MSLCGKCFSFYNCRQINTGIDFVEAKLLHFQRNNVLGLEYHSSKTLFANIYCALIHIYLNKIFKARQQTNTYFV